MRKKKWEKAGAWTLAVVLGTGMLWSGSSSFLQGSTVSAAPLTGELTAEVDLRQNGGYLYDANAINEKTIAFSGVNALVDLASGEAKEYFRIPLDDGTGEENFITLGNAMIKAYTVETGDATDDVLPAAAAAAVSLAVISVITVRMRCQP